MFAQPAWPIRRRLRRHGRRAPATVLDVSGVVTQINHRGAMSDANLIEWGRRVRVRVEPEGEPPFEVERRMRFPSAQPARPGRRIGVIYDPARPHWIMRDPDVEPLWHP